MPFTIFGAHFLFVYQKIQLNDLRKRNFNSLKSLTFSTKECKGGTNCYTNIPSEDPITTWSALLEFFSLGTIAGARPELR